MLNVQVINAARDTHKTAREERGQEKRGAGGEGIAGVGEGGWEGERLLVEATEHVGVGGKKKRVHFLENERSAFIWGRFAALCVNLGPFCSVLH